MTLSQFLLVTWLILLILGVPFDFSRVGKPRKPVSALEAWIQFWLVVVIGGPIVYALWSS